MPIGGLCSPIIDIIFANLAIVLSQLLFVAFRPGPLILYLKVGKPTDAVVYILRNYRT